MFVELNDKRKIEKKYLKKLEGIYFYRNGIVHYNV